VRHRRSSPPPSARLTGGLRLLSRPLRRGRVRRLLPVLAVVLAVGGIALLVPLMAAGRGALSTAESSSTSTAGDVMADAERTGVVTMGVDGAPVAPGTTPGSTAPGTTEPGTTAPGTTQPGSTAPRTTEPGSTEPGTTAPGSSAPGSATAAGRPGRPSANAVVATPPARNCPSAPMLKDPARNAIAIPSPMSTNGTDLTRVAEAKAYHDPKAPLQSALSAAGASYPPTSNPAARVISPSIAAAAAQTTRIMAGRRAA
jgi:hypothetical protein